MRTPTAENQSHASAQITRTHHAASHKVIVCRSADSQSSKLKAADFGLGPSKLLSNWQLLSIMVHLPRLVAPSTTFAYLVARVPAGGRSLGLRTQSPGPPSISADDEASKSPDTPFCPHVASRKRSSVSRVMAMSSHWRNVRPDALEPTSESLPGRGKSGRTPHHAYVYK